jgi:hypothetical protein
VFGITVQPDCRISTRTRSASIAELSLAANREASAGATTHVARTPMEKPPATTRRIRLRSLDRRILRRFCCRNMIGPDWFRNERDARAEERPPSAALPSHPGLALAAKEPEIHGERPIDSSGGCGRFR